MNNAQRKAAFAEAASQNNAPRHCNSYHNEFRPPESAKIVEITIFNSGYARPYLELNQQPWHGPDDYWFNCQRRHPRVLYLRKSYHNEWREFAQFVNHSLVFRLSKQVHVKIPVVGLSCKRAKELGRFDTWLMQLSGMSIRQWFEPIKIIGLAIERGPNL